MNFQSDLETIHEGVAAAEVPQPVAAFYDSDGTTELKLSVDLGESANGKIPALHEVSTNASDVNAATNLQSLHERIEPRMKRSPQLSVGESVSQDFRSEIAEGRIVWGKVSIGRALDATRHHIYGAQQKPTWHYQQGRKNQVGGMSNSLGPTRGSTQRRVDRQKKRLADFPRSRQDSWVGTSSKGTGQTRGIYSKISSDMTFDPKYPKDERPCVVLWKDRPYRHSLILAPITSFDGFGLRNGQDNSIRSASHPIAPTEPHTWVQRLEDGRTRIMTNDTILIEGWTGERIGREFEGRKPRPQYCLLGAPQEFVAAYVVDVDPRRLKSLLEECQVTALESLRNEQVLKFRLHDDMSILIPDRPLSTAAGGKASGRGPARLPIP